MTTSNIHIGLAAWSSGHSYSIGNRVSSNGNAYQAISNGTSGSTALSGTGSSFSDGGVSWKYLSSIDYTSLSAWGTAIPQTLTSNIVGLIWNDGVITTTAGTNFLVLGVNGSPRTTGSYTITLTAAPGESFRDTLKGSNTALAANSANGVCFQLPSTAGNTNYFDIYDGPIIFDGLQFIDPCSTSKSSIINTNSGVTLTISHCIVDGYPQDNGTTTISGFGGPVHLSNTLLIDRTATGSGGVMINSADSNTSSAVVNNTFIRINPTNGTEDFAVAYNVNNAAVPVRNNIFVGYTYPVGGQNNLAQVDHCIMTSTTVGYATDNGNNVYSITASSQFVSATTDFRLIAGSAALNAGVTDTTDVPLSDDIIGYSRPQGTAWSIGAAEFPSQFNGTISLGTIRSSGNINSANNASASKSIGTISAVSTMQQIDAASAVVSIGTVSSNANFRQIDSLAATISIGSFTASGSIAPTLITASGQGTISFFFVGSAASTTLASATNTISFSTTTNPYAAVALPTMAPTASGTLQQYDLATGLATLSFNSTGSYISASVINLSATVNVPITVSAQALQFTPLSSTDTVGAITANISAQQQDITTSATSIGAITAIVAAQQAGNTTCLVSIGTITASGSIQQVRALTGVASLGTISSAVSINQAYLLNTPINLIRNPFVVGGVIGTPGTLPTNWFYYNANGLSAAIVAIGAESGIPCIDIQFSGTATSTNIIEVAFDAGLTISSNTTYTQSVYMRVIAGSLTNVNQIATQWDEYNGASYIQSNFQAVTVTSAALSTQRFSATATSGSSTNAAAPVINLAVTSGNAINLTLRIGGPRFELGSAPSLLFACSFGEIAATVASQQSDQAILSAKIGPISVASATATNPYPLTAAASIGSITSSAALGALITLSGLATIGSITCVASYNDLVFTQRTIVLSAAGTATNPIPATSIGTLGAISAAGTIQNPNVLAMAGTSSIGAMRSQSTARQDDPLNATISLLLSAVGLAASNPNLRVSQAPIEVLSSGGNLRLTQTQIEVASAGGNLRVSQAQIEVLSQSPLPSTARVSQVIGEVLASGLPRALASQVVQEVLTGGSSLQNVRMTQVVTEVLTGGSATQNVRMSQIVVETLISAVPLPNVQITYIAA